MVKIKQNKGEYSARITRSRAGFELLDGLEDEFPTLSSTKNEKSATKAGNNAKTALATGQSAKSLGVNKNVALGSAAATGKVTEPAGKTPDAKTPAAKTLAVKESTLAETLKHKAQVDPNAGQIAKTATTPWNALFKDNRDPKHDIKLRYVPPKGDTLDFGDRTLPSMVEMWSHCLVGLFTGKFPGLKAVHAMKATWGVKCLVRSHNKDWLIFKFQNEEDRAKVLHEGPYTVFGKLLMLKELSEDFTFEDEEFLKIPIWIKFPNLPMSLWNDEAMSEVASMVGIPITTDKITQERANNDYARVLIEVDVSKPPPLHFPIRLPSRKVIKQSVVYETFPNFCFHCKEFGHHPFICKKLAKREDVARKNDCSLEKNGKIGIELTGPAETAQGSNPTGYALGPSGPCAQPGTTAACVPYSPGYGPDPTGSSQKIAQGIAMVEKHAQGPSKLPVAIVVVPPPAAQPTKQVVERLEPSNIEVENPDRADSEEEDSSSEKSSDTMDSEMFHEVEITCRDGTKKTIITMKPQKDYEDF